MVAEVVGEAEVGRLKLWLCLSNQILLNSQFSIVIYLIENCELRIANLELNFIPKFYGIPIGFLFSSTATKVISADVTCTTFVGSSYRLALTITSTVMEVFPLRTVFV